MSISPETQAARLRLYRSALRFVENPGFFEEPTDSFPRPAHEELTSLALFYAATVEKFDGIKLHLWKHGAYTLSTPERLAAIEDSYARDASVLRAGEFGWS